MAIFFLACFNYLNLPIAVSFKRAREVGLRELIGGNNARLAIQFLSEVVLVCFISLFIAILLTEMLIPFLNYTFELDVRPEWKDQNVLLFLFGVFLPTSKVIQKAT